MTGDQENDVTGPDATKVTEPDVTKATESDVTKVTEQDIAEKFLTMEILKTRVYEKLREMEKDVFGILKEVKTQQIIDYLIMINLNPLVEYYWKKTDGDEGAIKDVLNNVWPGEKDLMLGCLKTSIPKEGDLIPAIHTLLETEEFDKRIFEPLMEKLLAKTDTMTKMEEYFSKQEYVLKQLKSELSVLHSVGKFSGTIVNTPSEQVAKPSISRGDLKIEVDEGRAIIIAGNEFSVFVKIINPFEVPIVLYSVETQIPVDLIDFSPKRVLDTYETENKKGWKDTLGEYFEDLIGGRAVDSNPESRVAQGIATPDLQYLKVGLKPQPIILQPDDSIVKQFVFKTKSRLFFTPIALNLEIQVKYGVDYREHLDTVKSELAIQAELKAVVIGAIFGGFLGYLVRSLSFGWSKDSISGFGLAVILSAMVVVAFARKSGVQKIVTVEDFYGGIFLGFVVGYSDPESTLGFLTKNETGTNILSNFTGTAHSLQQSSQNLSGITAILNQSTQNLTNATHDLAGIIDGMNQSAV
jgi:hypothetical protein